MSIARGGGKTTFVGNVYVMSIGTGGCVGYKPYSGDNCVLICAVVVAGCQ